MSRVDCLGKVLVVVNRQEVPMSVGVSNHHLYIREAVNVQDELVELLEFTRLDPVYGEPSELCSVLKKEEEGKKK